MDQSKEKTLPKEGGGEGRGEGVGQKIILNSQTPCSFYLLPTNLLQQLQKKKKKEKQRKQIKSTIQDLQRFL